MIRFWKVIYSIDTTLSGVLLGAMILLGFSNVASRYFLNASLAASEEILTFALVFIALLASAPGIKRNTHVGMSLLVDKTPATYLKYFTFLKTIAYLIFFGILFYFGVQNTYESWKYGQSDSALGWPAWIFFVLFPLGALFCILESLSRFWGVIKKEHEPELTL
jgi:C4-dicarboxylate transporter, DctQ subunit